MSKELRAFRKICKNLNSYEFTDEYKKNKKLIETALKRIDYLERVIKDLQESKGKLIEERNIKIIEHRIVYNDYNFQSIKKFVACKGCQYYENEKCSNKDDCFWLELERKLTALEIIKEKKVDVAWLLEVDFDLERYNRHIAPFHRYDLNTMEIKILREELL